jgi:branched-chain amino acid transport system ATP-binding protein
MSGEPIVEATVELEDVTVRFGGLLALDEVSFDVQPMEIVGLIGPNGAGKTTAFNVICGFQKADSGTVRFPALGHNALTTSQLCAAGVARTLQGVGLFTNMSVLENVMAGAQGHVGRGFASSLFGFPAGFRHELKLRDDAMAQLERLGIAKFASALPYSIPYGISKKVSIARALMGRPSLLMLDEPASGLDENELQELAELIVQLRESMSVLLVEHNMDFVMPLVHRLVVLNFGKVIATGAPATISTDPEVLAAYLGVDS